MRPSDTPRLVDAIAAAQARIKKYGGRSLGEQNTKASLIEPVLEAMGWDVRDPDEVHREFKPAARDCPVDYALKVAGRPTLLVEAKALGEDLQDRRWVGQVLGYATMAGVGWCLLTDGNEYRVFNAAAPVDADGKFFFSVRLQNAVPEDTARLLGLVSRVGLQQGLAEQTWGVFFIDRQVAQELAALIGRADPTLVRVLQTRVPKATAAEVAASLRRLGLQVSPQIALELSGRREPAPRAPASGRRQRQSSAEITLQSLIERAALAAPLELKGVYKGAVLRAKLLTSGEVEYDGHRYPSCSAAAEAAISKAAGRPLTANGWTFWSFQRPNGQSATLFEVRTHWKDASSRSG